MEKAKLFLVENILDMVEWTAINESNCCGVLLVS